MTKIGIATSVSSLYKYDPFDTISYFEEKQQFDNIQIYLTDDFMKNNSFVTKLIHKINSFKDKSVYFHLSVSLNFNLFTNKNYLKCIDILSTNTKHNGFVIHYDHNPELMDYRKIFNFLSINQIIPIWIETYFTNNSEASYNQQLNKYLSIFPLYANYFKIFPVIDIPRFFHSNNEISIEQSTRDLFIAFNMFRENNLPILLHLIDVSHSRQMRNDFCPIGNGIIPYERIFNYIILNNINIQEIILEYEDKIKPLDSYIYLSKILNV